MCGQRGRGAEVDAVRHQQLALRHEHVLHQQRARDRAAHAERVPVADDADARRVRRDREIERVAAARVLALGALGAQDAVVVGRARERGEDLLAVDQKAAVDRLRLGAERCRARRRRAAFGEGLRIDRAVLDDAAVVRAARRVVRGALRGAHLQIVGERAGPQRGAHMHVPRERGRAAVAAKLGGGETVGAERCAEPAMFLRHADAQQPFGVHVAEILDREGRVAVVLRGAGREHARAEAARLVDQRGFFVAEPEGIRREDRRVAVVRVDGRMVHAARLSGRAGQAHDREN